SAWEEMTCLFAPSLGLSVVKAIMCAHGGDVSYSLTPENGSLFKLSWPV
ncbi:ATP-binding protein, partial [Klebsiella pneumoniae]